MVGQHLVDAGEVEAFDLTPRWNRYDLLNKLTLGWWPADVNDPESPLLPPPHLKAKYPNYKGKWQEDSDISVWIMDGISEMSDWLMFYTTEREAKGEIKVSGQQLAASFQDGEGRFGSPGQGHYGTIQNLVKQWVTQSKGMHCHVLWTALELRAKDDMTGLPIYGPDVIGKAETARAVAWFEQSLHGWRDPKSKERRLYLTNHYDEYGMEFRAKNTASFHFPLPEYLSNPSLGTLLEMLDESRRKTAEKFAKEG